MARPDELTFAPLGGVGEIGMNLSIYGLGDERRRAWLAVDLGVSFASEEHLPGVDLILPDIRFLVAQRKKHPRAGKRIRSNRLEQCDATRRAVPRDAG